SGVPRYSRGHCAPGARGGHPQLRLVPVAHLGVESGEVRRRGMTGFSSGGDSPVAKWPFRRPTFERTLWTVLVWFLFGLFVLGPLATVFAFSFTSSVLSGTGTFTLKWYGQLRSEERRVGKGCRSRVSIYCLLE